MTESTGFLSFSGFPGEWQGFLLTLPVTPRPCLQDVDLRQRLAFLPSDPSDAPPLTVDLGEHSQALFRFAYSLTGRYSLAEELVQETMLRAVRQGDRISGISNLRSWLFTVAINIWRDERRKITRNPATCSLQAMDPPQPDMAAELEETRERLQAVLKYFQQLPERQREVLFLKTVEGLSIAEIARVTGATSGSVKTNLCLARKRLRKHFDRPAPEVSS